MSNDADARLAFEPSVKAMRYRHKKTGKIYRWLAAGIDCTNSRDGTAIVVYCQDDNEHTIYIREQDEFNDRFEPLRS